VELPPPLTAPCAIAAEIRPWLAPPAPPAEQPPAAASGSDYRHRLRPTPAGWPTRRQWCVWVEPIQASGPAALWEQRWHQAVLKALHTWQELLPITLVTQPDQAQVLVQRRRPPLQNQRASHGRALLELLEVKRSDHWQLEPRVTVLISPGQAQPAIQATALHELGHAFGLWGHSDQAGDVMAATPGAKPLLLLSARDRLTLQWLQQQPGLQPAPAP